MYAVIRGAARPGVTLTDDEAFTIGDLLLKSDEALRAAHDEARRLMDLYGQDDPRTMAAVIRVVNLNDPGFADRAMAECGLTMPEPSRHDDNGAPLFSVEAIAAALGEDPDEVAARVEEMVADGVVVCASPAGRMH